VNTECFTFARICGHIALDLILTLDFQIHGIDHIITIFAAFPIYTLIFLLKFKIYRSKALLSLRYFFKSAIPFLVFVLVFMMIDPDFFLLREIMIDMVHVAFTAT
jgi:hypothetical protein